MQRVITLTAHGRQLTIGQYVEIVKRVKASAPGTRFDKSFCNWWSTTREEILREFFEGVQDRINKHLRIAPELTATRLFKLKASHLTSECRWCGQSLGAYKNEHERFCAGSSCWRDYYNL